MKPSIMRAWQAVTVLLVLLVVFLAWGGDTVTVSHIELATRDCTGHNGVRELKTAHLLGSERYAGYTTVCKDGAHISYPSK